MLCTEPLHDFEEDDEDGDDDDEAQDGGEEGGDKRMSHGLDSMNLQDC